MDLYENLVKEYKQKEQDLFTEFSQKKQELFANVDKTDRPLAEPIKNIYLLDSFMANGNKYIIRTDMTITRFEAFENLQIEVSFGSDFRTLFDNLSKTYELVNSYKLADAAVMMHNIMNGVAETINEREPQILKLCALFICREGEDLAKYDIQLMKAKIEDWRVEGIAMENFFALAFNLVHGFTPVYNQILANISNQVGSKTSRK
tara:strand:+ start:20077 stop:20691 length:615 start_codon:yes stop_codon:yes gene_type:complete